MSQIRRAPSSAPTEEPAAARAASPRAAISRRAAWFLVAVGVWTWVIWPTFLKNIWADPRSFDHGPTAFLLVHAVLVAASLLIGTTVGVIGGRALSTRR